MRQRALLSDGAIAVVAAAVVLIASPGVAVTGLIALIVLVVCGVSLLIGSRRSRGRVRRRHGRLR